MAYLVGVSRSGSKWKARPPSRSDSPAKTARLWSGAPPLLDIESDPILSPIPLHPNPPTYPEEKITRPKSRNQKNQKITMYLLDFLHQMTSQATLVSQMLHRDNSLIHFGKLLRDAIFGLFGLYITSHQHQSHHSPIPTPTVKRKGKRERQTHSYALWET